MTLEHTTITCCVLHHYQGFNGTHTQIGYVLFLLTHRCFLALDGGAVEAQGGHTVGLPLDVEDALIVPLSRLRLGQVLGG